MRSYREGGKALSSKYYSKYQDSFFSYVTIYTVHWLNL